MTYLDIINAAVSRSQFNDRAIYTPLELVGVINRYMAKLYGEIAEVNPRFLADSADVDVSSSTWTIPSNAESVYRVEVASGGDLDAGTRVNVVPEWDREHELAPRIYLVGTKYRSVGLTGDPASEKLTFFFSTRYTAVSSASGSLDANFPVIGQDLPIIRVARYLQIKRGVDSGSAEIKVLDEEESDLKATLILHLTHRDRAMRSRFEDFPTGV